MKKIICIFVLIFITLNKFNLVSNKKLITLDDISIKNKEVSLSFNTYVKNAYLYKNYYNEYINFKLKKIYINNKNSLFTILIDNKYEFTIKQLNGELCLSCLDNSKNYLIYNLLNIIPKALYNIFFVCDKKNILIKTNYTYNLLFNIYLSLLKKSNTIKNEKDYEIFHKDYLFDLFLKNDLNNIIYSNLSYKKECYSCLDLILKYIFFIYNIDFIKSYLYEDTKLDIINFNNYYLDIKNLKYSFIRYLLKDFYKTNIYSNNFFKFIDCKKFYYNLINTNYYNILNNFIDFSKLSSLVKDHDSIFEFELINDELVNINESLFITFKLTKICNKEKFINKYLKFFFNTYIYINCNKDFINNIYFIIDDNCIYIKFLDNKIYDSFYSYKISNFNLLIEYNLLYGFTYVIKNYVKLDDIDIFINNSIYKYIEFSYNNNVFRLKENEVFVFQLVNVIRVDINKNYNGSAISYKAFLNIDYIKECIKKNTYIKISYFKK